MRKPNATCKMCGCSVYKRPSLSGNVFCNIKCYASFRSLKKISCKKCGKQFSPWNKSSKYCSKQCSNHSKLGIKYGNYKFPGRSANERRLNELKSTFGFESCMVRGCDYRLTFDVHRLICGKDGGKYEIGNMFAICPNHHAEVHRHIIVLQKINDYELIAIDIRKDKPIGDGTRLESERG